MRRTTVSISASSIAGVVLSLTGAACDNADDHISTQQSASVTVPQTPLSGNSVAKFVMQMQQPRL